MDSVALLNWLGAVTRLREWWWYKIPPLLAVGYALMLVQGATMRTIAVLGAAMFALCCVAAFAYTVNDATDLDDDVRRGKPNTVGRLPFGGRVALALLFSVAALLIAASIAPGWPALVLFALELSLPLLYSVRPFRLKDRGVHGLVADTAMVSVVPVIWLGVVLIPGSGGGLWYSLVLTTLVMAASGLGLRGALLHQWRIQEEGLRVRLPFALRLSAASHCRVALRHLLPLEWIALVATTLLLVPVAPIMLVIAPLVVHMEWKRLKANWRIPAMRDGSGHEPRYVPLVFNEVQEIILPLGLALQLAFTSPWFILLTCAHVIAFWPTLRSLRNAAHAAERRATSRGSVRAVTPRRLQLYGWSRVLPDVSSRYPRS